MVETSKFAMSESSNPHFLQVARWERISSLASLSCPLA